MRLRVLGGWWHWCLIEGPDDQRSSDAPFVQALDFRFDTQPGGARQRLQALERILAPAHEGADEHVMAVVRFAPPFKGVWDQLAITIEGRGQAAQAHFEWLVPAHRIEGQHWLV